LSDHHPQHDKRYGQKHSISRNLNKLPINLLRTKQAKSVDTRAEPEIKIPRVFAFSISIAGSELTTTG
jgi:hypothetical protein